MSCLLCILCTKWWNVIIFALVYKHTYNSSLYKVYILGFVLKQSNHWGRRALVYLVVRYKCFIFPFCYTFIPLGALGGLLLLIVALTGSFVYLLNSFSRKQVHCWWRHPFFFFFLFFFVLFCFSENAVTTNPATNNYNTMLLGFNPSLAEHDMPCLSKQ